MKQGSRVIGRFLLLLSVLCLLPLSSCGTSTAVTADTVLHRAMQANFRDGTFTFDMQSSLGTSQLEFAGKGHLLPQAHRTDLDLDGTFGQIRAHANYVIDDQDTYFKVQNQPSSQSASWHKEPTNQDDFGMLGLQDVAQYDQLAQPVLVGEETINGVATYHIKAAIQSPFQAHTKTEDLWLRKDNFFPQQIKRLFSDAGTSTAYGQVETTQVFTQWNSGVTIPIPPASS
jgi:hypothetical protein